jgi:hypothetical protein
MMKRTRVSMRMGEEVGLGKEAERDESEEEEEDMFKRRVSQNQSGMIRMQRCKSRTRLTSKNDQLATCNFCYPPPSTIDFWSRK